MYFILYKPPTIWSPGHDMSLFINKFETYKCLKSVTVEHFQL